jgi:phenylacetate-CoA ligase
VSGAPALDVLESPKELDDASALADYQLQRVNSVLERALAGDFYRRKLAGLPARVRSLEEFRSFPTTVKREVLADVEAHPPFGSRARLQAGQLRQVVTTSGTTGVGQEVYALDAEDEAATYVMEARGFRWAGVDASSVVLNTLPMTTTAAGQWYYHGLRLLRAVILPVGTFPTERKVDYLLRFSADTIVGTPSYVYRLAEAAREAGLEPARLGVRRLVMAGESWALEWMQDLARAWGAKPFEQYGCTQRALAWNCPRGAVPEGGRGVLHSLPDHGLYEVVDPASGEPVGPGQFGELVITPFLANASPLVRFATGDRVQVAAECGCGRPGIGLVSGRVNRYDHMVKVKGLNLWPEALDSAVFGVAGVREYQAAVRTLAGGREVLEVEVEAETARGRVEEDVAAAIRDVTGIGAAVRLAAPGTIAAGIRGEFTKRSRLVDRRGGKER